MVIPVAKATTVAPPPRQRRLPPPGSLALPRRLALVDPRGVVSRMTTTTPLQWVPSPAPSPAPRPLGLPRRRSSTRRPMTSRARRAVMTLALKRPRPRPRRQTAASALPECLPWLAHRELTLFCGLIHVFSDSHRLTDGDSGFLIWQLRFRWGLERLFCAFCIGERYFEQGRLVSRKLTSCDSNSPI